MFILIELCVLLSHDFKQTALNGNEQLVHIVLVGFPATAEILIGQLHIDIVFFDIYFSWCVFHRKYLPSEFLKC